jgi:hypothetical protein
MNLDQVEGTGMVHTFGQNSISFYADDIGASGRSYTDFLFKRAPGFFDVVAYTGITSPALTVPHNLSVAPELMIVRERNSTANWYVYSQTLGASLYLVLNSTSGYNTNTSYWNNTTPTSSQFVVGASPVTNSGGGNYIAYLFATCPGVSKVGSYTGTGTTLNIDCGFTAGARFVMVKRADDTGSWYFWDTARGIVSGNERYWTIPLGSSSSYDYIDPLSSGFQISSSAPDAINADGGSFIFFAIA